MRAILLRDDEELCEVELTHEEGTQAVPPGGVPGPPDRDRVTFDVPSFFGFDPLDDHGLSLRFEDGTVRRVGVTGSVKDGRVYRIRATLPPR